MQQRIIFRDDRVKTGEPFDALLIEFNAEFFTVSRECFLEFV
jgi:hypothetical protein